MARPGRKALGSGDMPLECSRCWDCDGGGQEYSADRAKHRYRHYLNFMTRSDLKDHLEAQPRQPDPPLGYSFEQWLQGVAEWYTMRKMRERSDEDLARFRETQVFP